MLSKQDILDSILKECDIALHLAAGIPDGGLEYRQSADQRTNLELLRYLSYCAIGGARAMIDGNWDGYHEWAARHGDISADEFPAAMERQKEALREALEGLGEPDLQREARDPLGNTMTLERALLELPLKWIVGYRMQLFCGAKAAGNDELWTPDCWGGVSLPRDSQPA